MCVCIIIYTCAYVSHITFEGVFFGKKKSHIIFDHSHAHNTYTCEAKDNFKDKSPIETINDKIPRDVLGKWMIECNMMF